MRRRRARGSSVPGGSVRRVSQETGVQEFGARAHRAAVPAGGHEPPAAALASRDEAEAYVASVCFKHGPPRLVGVELEWLVHSAAAPATPLEAGPLRAALGPHAPTSLDPRSPAWPLPGGSTVTVEPGG